MAAQRQVKEPRKPRRKKVEKSSKGLSSPHLKNFVVARVNFLRFKKGVEFDFEETVKKMVASTKKIDPAKVDRSAIAAMGGAPADDEGSAG